jgi:hypothetical protein
MRSNPGYGGCGCGCLPFSIWLVLWSVLAIWLAVKLVLIMLALPDLLAVGMLAAGGFASRRGAFRGPR